MFHKYCNQKDNLAVNDMHRWDTAAYSSILYTITKGEEKKENITINLYVPMT